MRHEKIIYLVIFFFALSVFLLHFLAVGSGVWGDGQYYYSYLRSLVIDNNLDFTNEMEHFLRPVTVTETGMVANKYSVGPTFLWLPFFLDSHLATLLLQAIGITIAADGYQALYQVSVGIGAVFYGIAGLFLCQKTGERYFPKITAFLAAIFFWLSSNLFFYTAVDPINSHAVSFFVSSLLIYILLNTKLFMATRSIFLGLTGGLLITIRPQDAIILLPVIFAVGLNLKLFIFFLSVLIAFSPQLFVWQLLYGELNSPYLASGEKFYWLMPQIWQVWFRAANGLFLYSPIIIFSLIGLFILRKKAPIVALSGILLFILQSYIIGSWHYYTQGASYGGRMFISLSPFFIFGLAAFIKTYEKYMRIVYSLLSLLVIINFYFMIKFLLVNP